MQHLYCVYESFYPDKNSTLLDEVAQCVAGFINECGFDMAYMDGSEGMPDNGAGKMLECIYAKLKRPVRMEGAVTHGSLRRRPAHGICPFGDSSGLSICTARIMWSAGGRLCCRRNWGGGRFWSIQRCLCPDAR